MTQSDWHFQKITLATVYRTDWTRTRTEAGRPIKKLLSICPHKDEHRNAHSIIIHNSKSGNKQMSIYWWMDKQNIIYPYHGIRFSNKKKWSSDICHNIEKPRKELKWRKPDTKGLRSYNSISMNYPEKATGFSQKVDKWLPKTGVGVGINCKWAWDSLLGWRKCSKTKLWWQLHNFVNFFSLLFFIV